MKQALKMIAEHYSGPRTLDKQNKCFHPVFFFSLLASLTTNPAMSHLIFSKLITPLQLN